MNVNNNISNFDWSSTINTILGSDGAKGTNGLSGTGVVDGDSLVITVTNAEGKSVNFTVENPELDPATGSPDEATLRKIAERLDGVADEFERQYKELASQVEAMDIGPNSTGTQKVLYDIYQLMSMVIQLSQHQREVSRTMRYSDLQISTAAIQNQADAQRRAAQTGLIMSCCLSGISILASLGMAIKSNVAAAKATKMEMQIGANQSQKAYALSQARTPGDAASNLAKVEGSMTPQEIESAQAHFKVSSEAQAKLDESANQLESFIKGSPDLKAAAGELDGKITAKTSELEVAQKDLGNKQGQLKNTETKLQFAKESNKPQAEIDSLEAKVKSLTEEVGGLKEKVSGLKDEVNSLTDDRQRLLDGASENNEQLKQLNDTFKQDRADYEKALQADMEALDGKLDIAQGELDQMRKGGTASKEEIAQKEAEVKTLQKEAIWGRAHVTNEFHANKMDGALKAGMADCKANYDAKKVMLEADGEYRKAMAQANFWGGISQTVNQLNSLCQSLTQYAVSSQEAESTEMQKEQKEADAARDESSDLFSSSKEMLDAALKLMNAIQQTEQDTFRQIMA